MPHYFFHVCNSGGYLRDDEGQDLPNAEAAKVRAMESIRSIVSEEVKEGLADLRGRLEVTDAGGTTLLTMPFAEAIEVRTGPPLGEGVEAGVQG
jgi:hypothetical protein